ncbi:MAG: winged helix-turn-helix transcriptional regulator [Alphaproteobacteria bacterium]|nr:MAG: winged helix-turn-helix transcriptional regulator [Alphaproteobacteria bacterium]
MLRVAQLKEIAVECPGFRARATARAVTRFFNARFRPLDLTGEQFSLLIGIATAQGTTVAGLAAESGVDATTLSRNVQNLERRKLVRGTGRGRAGKRLELTKTGRRLLEEAVPLWRQAYAELTAALGENRLRSANRAMRAVADAAS